MLGCWNLLYFRAALLYFKSIFNCFDIFGICDFPSYSPLFILSIYLPLVNDKIEVFNEYFYHLWALYDTLSADGYAIMLEDFNGDIRNSLGEFANFINLCPVNLLKSCIGPVETYYSHCAGIPLNS